MKKENFIKLYNCIQEFDKWFDDLYYTSKIDLYDSVAYDTMGKIFNIFFKEMYGEDGKDWIDWFLYEKMGSDHPEEMKAWDKDGNEICKNIEELWEMLEKDYKIKDSDSQIDKK